MSWRKKFSFGLYSAIWLYEVGIISNRKPERYGEFVEFALYT